jgi:hypothetical protein
MKKMATDEQMQQVIEKLNTSLNKLWTIHPEDLARESDLGKALSFQPALPYIHRMIQLFKGLQGHDLTRVSYSTLIQIQSQAEAAAALLKRIEEFSPVKSGNASGERLQLINEIRDNYDSYYNNMVPTLAFLSSSKQIEEPSRAEQADLLRALRETRQQAAESLKQLNSIVTAAREASATTGVSEQSACFRNQANLHKRAAWTWLLSGGVLAAGSALFAWLALSTIPQPGPSVSTAQYIHFALPRVLVLSLLFYVLFWSAKNYVSHRHNEVVNRHRQNALQTFETFVHATKDDAIKDAVLIRATQAIFTPQPTGYAPSDVEPPIPSAMVQILREAAEKK